MDWSNPLLGYTFILITIAIHYQLSALPPPPPPRPVVHGDTPPPPPPHPAPPLVTEPVFYPAPATRQSLVNADKLLFTLPRLDFAIVSDLDQGSRDSQKFLWRSHFKRGALLRKSQHQQQSPTDRFDIQWSDETILESKTSYRNRSMELSELVRYDHLLLAMCDITGLVFKIKQEKHQKPQVFQRWALADGDGEKAKPFKGEWATVKDGMLYMGSTGKEWTSLGGLDGTFLVCFTVFCHIYTL